MEDEKEDSHKLIESVFVTGTTATSIEVAWQVQRETVQNIQGYRVHFQKIGSRYIQNSPMLPSTSNEYSVGNLMMDTYYKVCLIMYRNDTTPVSECVDASTTNWHIPVSIGSSIGAVLALSIIVFLVFVSRCPTFTGRSRKTVTDSGKYDSMSSHAHEDNYELSDTTTQAHDDEIFSDHDSANFELMQPPHISGRHHHHHHHHHGDRTANGNRNFIKPSIPAHVLHMHSSRSSSKPHSDSHIFLPRHLVGGTKSTRHAVGLPSSATDRHISSPPLRIATSPKSRAENHLCNSTPDTIGSPNSTTSDSVSLSFNLPTSPVSDKTDSSSAAAILHNTAGSPTTNTDSHTPHGAIVSTYHKPDTHNHEIIPRQTVAQLEQNASSRQHTV